MDEDMLNNLNNILKNGTIPDNIKDIMSNITNNSPEEQNDSSSFRIKKKSGTQLSYEYAKRKEITIFNVFDEES